MGRHSAPDHAPPPPDLRPPDPPHDSPHLDPAQQLAPPAERPRRRLIDQFTLAVPAAGGTGAVMAWAGAPPAAYLLGAAGTGVVVLVAAQLAGSLPPSPRSRSDRPRRREP